jgi:hypothetical protein
LIPAVPDWALLAGVVAILVAALLFRRHDGNRHDDGSG